jgi:hypothetical protein
LERDEKNRKKSTSLNSEKRIYPSDVTIDPEDDKTIILQFDTPELLRGACYNLLLPDLQGFLFEYKENHGRICFSLCGCDPKSTVSCAESKEADPICQCKRHHVGHTCSECEEGYAMESETGACRALTTCSSDTCSGHGECI